MTLHYKYPFLILVFVLISGILYGGLSDLPYETIYVGFGCSALLYFISLYADKHVRLLHQFSDIFMIWTVFLLGLFLTQDHFRSFTPDPTVNYSIKSRCEGFSGNQDYILSIQNEKFYLSHFYTDRTFTTGDSLFFYGKIYPLKNNSNAEEFSYSRYLQQQGVYFKIIPQTTIEKRGHSQDFFSFFEDVRKNLMQKTNGLLKDSTHSALINALCLGFRNDINDKTQQLFISTGTVHLLSVSGLHVGAIYLLILFLFKRAGISNKKNELLIIPLLWGYACLTGLSPSVVRAATILSFITLGDALGRDYTPLNSIAASAFLTLLIQPQAIYSISFQLSYAAYTGIIILYPFLNRLPGKLPTFPSKIYASICITIAAQVATLPICAYYFHTANISGFLANIIVVPISTLLLYLSTVLLLLPVTIGSMFAFIVNAGCELLILTLELLDKISMNITELYPSLLLVVFIYLNLLFIGLYLLKRKLILLRISILSVSFLLFYCCAANIYLHKKQEIIIFNIYNKSCILFNRNGFYSFLKSDTIPSQKIMPYILKNNLQQLPDHTGFLAKDVQFYNNVLQAKDYRIHIADHQNTVINEHTNVLIVTNNISPEKLFFLVRSEDSDISKKEKIKYPEQIIADGSNTRYYLKQWEDFCMEKCISFSKTSEIGSISLTLK